MAHHLEKFRAQTLHTVPHLRAVQFRTKREMLGWLHMMRGDYPTLAEFTPFVNESTRTVLYHFQLRQVDGKH